MYSDAKKQRVRGASSELIAVAQTMRSQPTEAENALWIALQRRRLGGLKFRFQHPIGTYILDFYCPALKLVLEVDGTIHDKSEIAERDKERQMLIESHGYRVLRFSNTDVLRNLPFVLQRILQEASMPPGNQKADKSVEGI